VRSQTWRAQVDAALAARVVARSLRAVRCSAKRSGETRSLSSWAARRQIGQVVELLGLHMGGGKALLALHRRQLRRRQVRQRRR